MSGLFRSQAMEYVSITMTTEAARVTIHQLGEANKLHVVDLSEDDLLAKQHTMHKKLVVECGTMERKLLSFEEEMESYGVECPPISHGTDMDGVADVLADVKNFIDPIIERYQSNLNFIKENKTAICYNEEWIEVLKACKSEQFADSVPKVKPPARQRQKHPLEESESEPTDTEAVAIEGLKNVLGVQSSSAASAASGDESVQIGGGYQYEDRRSDGNLAKPLLIEDSAQGESSFRSIISGTIPLLKKWLFARALYRVSRGNAIVQFMELPNGVPSPTSDERIAKSVFSIMVIGKQLDDRVRKMCSNYDAVIYPVPTDGVATDRLIAEKMEDNTDKRTVLAKTKHQLIRTLETLAHDNGRSPIRDWQLALRKEMGVHEVLMKAHFTQNLICIEGWVPAQEISNMRSRLSSAFQGSSHPAPAFEANPQNPLAVHKSPPTYFDTGSITSIFQGIVDTYGIGRYQEANPGLFTIMTFPFLFGVMYGDVGHGIFLLLASIFMIYKEKEILDLEQRGKLSELVSMPFGGRYMLFMMSCFAIFCGFIYNDCMSMPIFLFESNWKNLSHSGVQSPIWNTTLNGVYPFGIDPEWAYKSNSLEFMNSFKMKLAVILGVTQMMFGVILAGTNHVYYKDWLSLWFEWIPQVLFLGCTFGYMIFLIVFKWCIDWSVTVQLTPPGILQIMLKFFLSPGRLTDDLVLYNEQTQQAVQIVLFTMAIASVPVMLLVKPLVLGSRMKSAHHAMGKDPSSVHIGGINGGGMEVMDDSLSQEVPVAASHHEEEEHSFGDLMVHQIIHTIEYVLGAISNTASYLRLWALSLAHSQLAEVFWKQFMEQTYNMDSAIGGIAVMVGCAAWMAATCSVLLMMDSLECFLHALRLHWVEFQNKFYFGDGYKFEPFNFEPKKE